MAILFDWYENPKNKERQNEELTLHPAERLHGHCRVAKVHTGILFADRNGCFGCARCSVALHGTGIG